MAHNPPKAYAHIPENELSYRHFLEYENLDEPLSERLARRDFEFYMIDTKPRIAKEYEGWRKEEARKMQEAHEERMRQRVAEKIKAA